LRQRLRLSESQIVLAPSAASSIDLSPGQPLDRIAFREVLRILSGTDSLRDLDAASDEWAAESDTLTLKVDRWDTRYVVRDLRGYHAQASGLPRDDLVIAQAQALLGPMGVRDAEIGSMVVHTLVGQAADETGVDPTPIALARKVFVYRKVGGISVKADRLVITFAVDGTFRKMLGRWHPVDYKASYLSSTLTPAQFVEAALDMLVAKNVSTQSDLPIRLFTDYVPLEASPGVFVLDLKGVAMVSLHGPNGTQLWDRYDFDI
jgi:hypothetical protein